MSAKTALVSVGVLVVASALAACSSGDETQAPKKHSGKSTSSGTGGADTGVGGAGTGGASTGGASTGGAGTGGTGGAPMPPPPCPDDMAFVDTFCMDLYEAPNQPGVDPMVMQSATGAEAWCASAGKRLCTEDEWDKACEGPNQSTYPYGDTHVTSRCNDDKTWKVVNEGVLNTWPSQAAKDEVAKLYQGSPSGAYGECVSGYGVYDLTGNIEEWVIRTKPHVNSYPHVLKGCYWAGCFGGSKPTCASTNPAHADGFMYYETGFRCCADLTK